MEVLGYIRILRDTTSYRNDFFYPHGALFTLFLSGVFGFYVHVYAVCYSCGLL